MKNVTSVLFLVLFYLVSREIGEVNTLDLNKNLKTSQTSEQEDNDRWSWGSITTIKTTTTTESSVTDRYGEIDCNSTPEPLPDFRKPGKRISETKCDEYIWYSKDLEENRRRMKECRPHKNISVIIAGGNNARPGEYPHMCALGWKAVFSTWVFKCGGTLISPNFVLTAAHCSKASPLDSSIADLEPKIIRFGDRNIIDAAHGSFYPRDANIKRIIVHPQYKSPKKYNDIALIEIDQEFVFDEKIHPACLWTKFDTSSLGSRAKVTGWGVIESGTLKTRPVLQKAEVDLISSETCDQLLRPKCSRHWCGINETQICAGVLTGGIDTCQGDSGGPLQVKINLPPNIGPMYHLIGVTSFGFECARKDTPGIYTRVSAFVDWIESTVWK